MTVFSNLVMQKTINKLMRERDRLADLIVGKQRVESWEIGGDVLAYHYDDWKKVVDAEAEIYNEVSYLIEQAKIRSRQ